MTLIWLILGLTVLTGAPFAFERLRPRMSNKDRADAPGQFADLPDGTTHYRWFGPKGGAVAVCVHGLTTPSYVWAPVAERLGLMGFRVLVYDLYGRGYSDRPSGVQDSSFFNRQLDALLEHLGVEGDITLLGYSMGGAIATAYSAKNPSRLRQLCLVAPAGMGHALGPLVDFAMKHDWPGRWAMLGFYPFHLRRATEMDRGLPMALPDMVDRQSAETRWRGFAPAVLSSLRGVMSEKLQPAHQAISKAGVPVLAIWGQTDTVIPISGLGQLAQWNRSARQDVIDGAGHSLIYTDVDAVVQALKPLTSLEDRSP